MVRLIPAGRSEPPPCPGVGATWETWHSEHLHAMGPLRHPAKVSHHQRAAIGGARILLSLPGAAPASTNRVYFSQVTPSPPYQ